MWYAFAGMTAALLFAEEPSGRSFFSRGVESYLKQDYSQAIQFLKEAANSGEEKEKARKLLLKVYQEAVERSRKEGRTEEANRINSEAHAFFSDAPGLSRNFQPTRLNPRPSRSTVSKISSLPSPEKPEKKEWPKSAATPPAPIKKISWFWPALLVSSNSLTVTLFCFYFFGRKRRWKAEGEKTREAFAAQLAVLEKTLDRMEAEKISLKKEAETHKHTARTLEATLASQKEMTQSWREDLRRQIEEEKRRLNDLEGENRKLRRPVPVFPPAPKESVVNAETQTRLSEKIKEVKPSRSQVQHQKNHILSVLVNMDPAERKEGQGRIAVQALTLYQDFPQDALNFLKELASDRDPGVRLSIAPALARIADEKALEMLLILKDDASSEVKREALRCLKSLKEDPETGLSPQAREKIETALKQELEKAEWIY